MRKNTFDAFVEASEKLDQLKSILIIMSACSESTDFDPSVYTDTLLLAHDLACAVKQSLELCTPVPLRIKGGVNNGQ